jgi:hypothetical protein
VDTKKKELIGNFKNAGQAWCREPEGVLVHDFPQDALGQAIPYGIYSLNNNSGYVSIGDCFDTPRFAVASISEWWQSVGRQQFPKARRLLILADAGGSNSCRARVWKAQLQEQLRDEARLTVTVCHYPSGCSKWNPSSTGSSATSASTGQAGRCAASIRCATSSRGTTTHPGLKVEAVLKRGGNETGERVCDAQMRLLRLDLHPVCPQRNYTLRPRPLKAKNKG